ncbi:MAG TPA: DUF5666 domain-containing protein [Vicinamibacterales bacterium]|nr:DUF5666 domain-containing protein [Vicinamibacterales bacterium]
MRRAAVVLVAALVYLSLAAVMAAPDDQWARGKVTAVSADSITIDVKGQAMTFNVDTATDVFARGAGTKTREMMKSTGKKPVLTDIVKVGDNVEISYAESGGAMVAKAIRGGISAPAMTSAEGTRRVEGVVTAVSGTSLSVKPASGDAVTFVVDDKVRVVGRGLGTMAKEKQAEGAKVTLTDAIAVGDTIEVSYKAMGEMKHATAVSVIKKGT